MHPPNNCESENLGSSAASDTSTQKLENGKDNEIYATFDQWIHAIENLPNRCDLNVLNINQRKSESLNLESNNGQIILKIRDELKEKLLQQAQMLNVSLDTILQFSLHKALSVFGNGEHTVVGVVGVKESGHRHIIPTIVNHEEAENDDCSSTTKAILKIKHEFSITLNNLKKPFGIDMIQNKPSLFDTLFVIGEAPVEFKGLQLMSTNNEYVLVYHPKEIDHDAIYSLSEVIETILAQLPLNPKIMDLKFTSNRQEHLLKTWNENTTGEFPLHKRLHHLVEEAAHKTPNSVAIICDERRTTYQTLNESANQIAHYLVKVIEIKPEEFICLFLDKDEQLIMTLLGIWKSGGAYIPIDPTYPNERVKFVFNDTGAKFVITNQKHVQRLKNKVLEGALDVKILEIETLWKEAMLMPKRDLELPFLRSDQLAYVTYTSGTTGIPKGVYKEHRGVVNSITDLSVKYKMTPTAAHSENQEVIVLFSPYVFEPFVRQTLMALINSHILLIVQDNEKLHPIKFPALMKHHGVTYLNGTGSVIQEFNLRECPSLSRLVLVGEEFVESRYKLLREQYKNLIICEYGFTESALVSAINTFELDSERIDRSIGRPARNVKCYVLNPKTMVQMPIGGIGELFIGGMGVSRGYLNRPELTKERFLPNPYQTETERKLGFNSSIYKTGDLAKFLPNGEVEYLGRNDFQVKVRGIRIEPGEIESILLNYPNIDKCIVVARADPRNNDPTSRCLIGFYVSHIKLEESIIIQYLESKLPRYMIPARLIQVPKIICNINGKVDLKALPEVDLSIENQTTKKIMPHNELELKLCAIWSEVLGIPNGQIGINDDFFRLGGHSVTCIQLIGRVRQYLGYDLSIEDIFSSKTVSNLEKCCIMKTVPMPTGESNSEIRTLGVLPSNINMDEVESYFLASPLQQGLMYHHLKQSELDDAYIMQSVYEYRTEINVEKYKTAWTIVQQKYGALRLKFVLAENGAMQIIQRDQELGFQYLEISNEEQQKKIEQNDRTLGYSLLNGSLFRVYLLKKSDAHFNLLLSCHHIILDGWSLSGLMGIINKTYAELVQNRIPSNTPRLEYEKAQEYLQLNRGKYVDYWTNEINKIEDRCNLTNLVKESKRNETIVMNYDYVQEQKEISWTIGSRLLSKLKNVCTDHGVTLHSIFQFIWHQVLHIYGNGANQTVTGTIVSGRNLPVDNVDHAIGLFINTLPLIVDHRKSETILEAILQIQVQVNSMNGKTHVELGQLKISELKHQLFDSLFVLENYPTFDSNLKVLQKSLGFKKLYDVEKLDYPLAVLIQENGENNTLSFNVLYAGELFEERTMRNLVSVVEKLVNQIIQNPERDISSLEFLLDSETEFLESWNHTEDSYDETKTLHHIFEEMAQLNSEKPAVIYEDRILTYESLNNQANQFAHYLRYLHPGSIQPDQIIGLILEKNELMILSILSVWKSGAGYVPIDPSYPNERVEYMLEDTKAKIVITNSHLVSKFLGLFKDLTVIEVERFLEEKASFFQMTNPTHISTSKDLAYVIYTSGTTGKPKGVMIEHHGVVNLQLSLSKLFNLQKEPEVLLSFSNYVFDHFVEQMTGALLNGQTLLVLNDEMRSDKERLYNYMEKYGVTYLSGTPSVLSLYEYNQFKRLRRIDAVGEDFTVAVFNKIQNSFKGGLIINGYGPTEVSITTHKRLYPYPEKREDKSIGFQVANSKCYVLDSKLRRVPIGVIGELFLGGVGVGRGYLNRPDLTLEKFLPNPYQTLEEKKHDQNSRIYKTGDLARWLPNGEIEFLGRNDFQLKINGLRIELSEIETVLMSYPGISQAVILAQQLRGCKNGARSIVGFYTNPNHFQLTEKDIKTFMGSKLPNYMIPKRVVEVELIPITINGKVDTKSLPEVEYLRNDEYEPPNTEIESKLASIWSELLGIPYEQIGIFDDFFGLGGDSLLVTSLSFHITKLFEKRVSVASIFQHRTIQTLGQYIMSLRSDNGQQNFGPEIIKDKHSESELISLMQERLLFIQEYEGGTDAYNIPIYLKLENVKLDSLKRAIIAVIQRHETLRTLIKERSQIVIPQTEVESMFQIDFTKVSSRAQLDLEMSTISRTVFNVEKELPVKVHFHQIENVPEFTYATLLFHHISFDQASWKIFQRELVTIYENNVGENLPELKIQYKDYSRLQRKLLSNTETSSTLETYWLNKLGNHEPLNLVSDYKRPGTFDYAGKDLTFLLDDNITNSLKILAKECRVSLYSVFGSAFALMLSHYCSIDDLVIGQPVLNRNSIEIENIIGFFVNLIVLRVKVNFDTNLKSYIQGFSEELIQSQLHQDMPFQKLVQKLKLEQDPSRHPICQVVFNMEKLNEGGCGAGDPLSFKLTEYKPEILKTIAKFDLCMTIIEDKSNDTFSCKLNFSTSLFHENTAKNFLQSFVHILEQYGKSQFQLISHISSFTTEMEQKLLGIESEEFELRTNETLHQYFEQIAETHSNAIALASGTIKLTYNELNQRSNQLSRFIQQKFGTNPNDDGIIGICLGKSELTIISILGIWKAGFAYLPLDPTYPIDRVQLLLRETQAKALITTQKLAKSGKLDGVSESIIPIDNNELFVGFSISNCVQTRPSKLAWVIFTSGTTSIPKGVQIEHSSGISFLNSVKNRYQLPSPLNVLFLSNFIFDFANEQILLALLTGGTLVIPPNPDTMDFDDNFYNYLNENKLTYLSGTPTLIQQFDLSRLNHLKFLTVAGENFPDHLHTKVRNEFQNGTLVNAYGLTESTIYNYTCIYEDSTNSPVGKFLPNTKSYILDERYNLVPVGGIGKLYLAGPCLSRGYLNQPKLNKEKFIKNPFGTQPEFIFDTGDVVRLSPENLVLQCIGRSDRQIKLKGFRIQLREIESVLGSHPNVKQCVVICKDSKYLFAYYIPKNPKVELPESALKIFLESKLPKYMVPMRVILLSHYDTLPATINGKIDASLLPDVSLVDFHQEIYTGPRNQLERKLCHELEKLLNLPSPLSIDANFFQLGLDSILSLEFASRVRSDLKFHITVPDLFTSKNIRNLMDAKGHNCDEESINVFVEEDTLIGKVPMLPIQKWFFAKDLKNPNFWNHSFFIQTPGNLDVRKLTQALDKLISYHDAFRLRFKVDDDGNYLQFYDSGTKIPTIHEFNSPEEAEKSLESLKRVLNIESGPMFSVAYISGYGDNSARIWFTIHHLIVDSVSWKIICRDLEILYNGGSLEKKGSSYRQWTAKMEKYPSDHATGEEKAYWANIVQEIKLHRVNLNVGSANIHRTGFSLDEETTRLLLTQCHETFETEINDLLLTALSSTLPTFTKKSKNFITLEGHGREELENACLNINHTIGFFTTMYPVGLECGNNMSESIRNVKKALGEIPNKGIGFGPLFRYTDQEILPNISFNYLGRLDSKTDCSKAWKLCGLTGEYWLDQENENEANGDFITITGFCLNNQMNFTISSRFEKAEDAISFNNEFKRQLEGLVAYTAPAIGSWYKNLPNFEPYYIFNQETKKGKQCLFLFPPGEGGAESYFNNLVKYLPKSIQLVVFNNYYLEYKKMYPAPDANYGITFQDLAKYYIKFIRRIQPDGPYNFCGWSFGGVLGFEISRQLNENNSTVKNLILIDSYFNVSMASASIGKPDAVNIIDPINYNYFQPMPKGIENVFLFKASVLNESYGNEDQKQLYEYYLKSNWNNLDSLIEEWSGVHKIEMKNVSHNTWVKNSQTIEIMCTIIVDSIIVK